MNQVNSPFLKSKSGVILPASHHVFFLKAIDLASELSRFMKEKTGLTLTFFFNGAEDNNELYVHIQEANETVLNPNGDEVTVSELLDEVYNYDFTEYWIARDLVLELYDLHQDHLSHLQYFDDEEEEFVRMSVSANAFSLVHAEPTIGGSYIARRAVSNLGYFILRAAQHNFDLSDHSVEKDPMDVNSALTEWMTDVEIYTSKSDPALEAIEAQLIEELTEGGYLQHGRESFLESVKGLLSSQDNMLIFPSLFSIIERSAAEAENSRRIRDTKDLF